MKVTNLVVPSNKEGGAEDEVKGGGRTSCTLHIREIPKQVQKQKSTFKIIEEENLFSQVDFQFRTISFN